MLNPRYAQANGHEAVARDGLLNAIAALAQERQRLEQLEAARERARTQSWELPHRVQEAEAALAKARHEENNRLALEYVSSGGGITAESPISAAQLALDEARAENDRISRVEAALDAELAGAAARLQRRQAAVHESLADLVLDSDAFKQLLEQHTEAWKRLRTIKVTLRTISHALGGFAPQSLADKIDVGEPLEIRTGYPVDEQFVGAWVDSLAGLLVDPDHELPA